MKNGILMQYFERGMTADGSVWRSLAADAPHLQAIGITAVWIPPCFKAVDDHDMGYGVYDVYDLGEFNQKNTVRTKYGTKEELHAAIEALHTHGIQVYADIVINHKAGADETERFTVVEVDPEDRNKVISEPYEIEGWTCFNFSGRGGAYSDFKWCHQHFSGTDYNHANGKSAVYLIQGENKNWNIGVDEEQGNYDYLMYADIDYENNEVREEIFKWIRWFVNETGVDGVRLDAIKHINDWFMRDFVDGLRKSFGENFYCVGEYWSAEKAVLEKYMRNTDYIMDLFDFPLHFKFHQASREGSAFDMRTLFDHTLVQQYKEVAVTFVDSHDSQPGQDIESFVEAWFKPLAYAAILLRSDGYPTVFYGDYYGISGDPPIPGHQEALDRLMQLRRENAFGDQYDYFDHENVIGWVRPGNDEHPEGCAVIMSNGEGGEKTMFVGEIHQGEVWTDRMGAIQDAVTIDEKGNGVFKTQGGSVSVYVCQREA